MGVMLLKKISLLVLLISASLLSTSLAGRQFKVTNKLAEKEVDAMTYEEEGSDTTAIHERLLRANTKDYGRYDPAPTLGKPPFKLIPN